MFDSFNRHFSKRGAENKKVLVTTNVLETMEDLDESPFPTASENVPDLDSIQIDDFSILSDMIPTTEPKVMSEPEDIDIISSTVLSADEDDDDFQDI
jgi:hypothetical protein